MEELELLIRQLVCSVVADIIVCKLFVAFWTTLSSSQLPLASPFVAMVLFLMVALSGFVSFKQDFKIMPHPGSNASNDRDKLVLE